MINRVITKDEFKKFVEALIQDNQTFGPQEVDKDKNGNSIFQFKEVSSFDELDLNYSRTHSSVKNFFLPFREKLSEFEFSKNDWKQNIEYRVNPRVIVGMRACDINGLCLLDQVFIGSTFPSPYYTARRKNTFIIGMDHEPLDDCFCKSLGHHIANRGYNIFCSDLGDDYYLTILSSKAFVFLRNFKTRDPNDSDNARYIKRRKQIEEGFKTKIEITDMPILMDIEFKSPVWDKWGGKCLSCGTCAMVCPTCYCYGVEENISTNLKTAVKERVLHSCNLIDFAEVAGGYNFRPKPEDRLKYRYYHHYRGFSENRGAQICVGCNRCGRACLAGISPDKVISDLRQENVKNEI